MNPASELREELWELRIRALYACGVPPVDLLGWIALPVAGDDRFRRWWDAVGRRGAGPGGAGLIRATVLGGVLDRVAAPTLLISRTGCASDDPGRGRYLAGSRRPGSSSTRTRTARGSSATWTGHRRSSGAHRGHRLTRVPFVGACRRPA